jgi:hypothetical protein
MAMMRTNRRRGFELDKAWRWFAFLSFSQRGFFFLSLFCNRNPGGQLTCRKKELVLDTRLPSARRLAFLFLFLFLGGGCCTKKTAILLLLSSRVFFESFRLFYPRLRKIKVQTKFLLVRVVIFNLTEC